MKKKNAQFNKKTATVALIFMLATIMWLTINVVWCLHDGHYANLIIPVLFVVAGVAMFYNEFHKKPRKHVEDVKKYLVIRKASPKLSAAGKSGQRGVVGREPVR